MIANKWPLDREPGYELLTYQQLRPGFSHARLYFATANASDNFTDKSLEAPSLAIVTP